MTSDGQNGAFFGPGLYTSTSSEYACLYAMDQATGGIVQSDDNNRNPRPKNKRGECVVIGLCALWGAQEQSLACLLCILF